MPHKRYQSGTVLVIALLVVAIIVGLATTFAAKFHLSVKRAENRLLNSQLQQYWYAIEHTAIYYLIDDKKDDIRNGYRFYDHFGEDWADREKLDFIRQAAQVELGISIPQLSLEDAQGRFNLNNLERLPGYKASNPFKDRYSEDQKRFIRLLQTRSDPNAPPLVDAIQAAQIVDAIADWLDDNNLAEGDGGAESAYYQSQQIPYLAANREFASVSELLLIKGFEERRLLYDELKPLLIALPKGVPLNVNIADARIFQGVNTADSETPISLADAESLIADRPGPSPAVGSSSKPFVTLPGDIQNVASFNTIFPDPANVPDVSSGFEVGTNYFLLSAQIEVGDVTRYFYSVIERQEVSGAYRGVVIGRSSDGVF